MTTPAQHKRDQATARVARLQEDMRVRLAALPELDDAGRTRALDSLVDTAEDLLRTEHEVEIANEQVRAAKLEEHRAGTQRLALYLAAVPVAVGMIAGAFMLFGGIGPVWVLLAVPLVVAGLRIALGPLGPTPLMVDRRLRAAWSGALAAGLTAAALIVLASTAQVVLVVLAAFATAAAVLFLVQEVR
ncbi:hypothetical protein [Amycolatopsis sp. FDAARGOS 1241]|uniref:hypothetical protein n=1 Tax=Amycolatopsis sp. FDAARGOS 1241 TaxID=2778070 RepID=UPI00194E5202|nr:hypothetical protein [Amycolatopsis sp. FDAARGOS 1241]QRP44830.1 hypothetical protein I6J71_37290 [Amycolatopsis sp. FDAARGOS 1241]